MSLKDAATYSQLTPTGRGAVAVVVANGPGIAKDLDGLFQPLSGKSLTECWNQPIIYGRWQSDGQMGEDLVVCPLNLESAEIHCHGGESAVAAIRIALEAIGYRNVNVNELASLSGISSWVQDVKQALKHVTTERCSLLLLNMLGQVDQSIEELVQRIRSAPQSAANEIAELLTHQDFGKHLTIPWSVVLCGEPNVGKSSLINAIVGFNRAIVHSVAGTTRDVVSQLTAIDGWPVELNDTAGLRETEDQIESLGIEKAQQAIENADLIVQVFDAADTASNDAIQVKHDNVLTVINKIDLSEQNLFSTGAVLTSATEGQGIDELIRAIGQRLVNQIPDLKLLPINARQSNVFARALDLIRKEELDQAIDLFIE